MNDDEYEEIIKWSEEDFAGSWDNIGYDDSLWIPDMKVMDTLSWIQSLPEVK